MKKKTIAGLAALGAALGAAAAVGVITAKKHKQLQLDSDMNKPLPPKRNIYFAGGGLAALSGAYYLIRDCGIPGDSIHILEESSSFGGAFNIGGSSETGYVCTSPKLLSQRCHPNLMDMLRQLRSVNTDEATVYDEIADYADANPLCENARIIDSEGGLVSSGFGLSLGSLREIRSLLKKKDEELSDISIAEFFTLAPSFFDSNLWTIVSSSYILRRSSSVLELKHILSCVSGEINELFSMRNTLRARYNLQETVIKALESFLKNNNVNFAAHCSVIDADLDPDNGRITAIHLDDNGTAKTFYLNDKDLCFITNGAISECATTGDYNAPAPVTDTIPASAQLWSRLIEKRSGLGSPARFYSADNNEAVISFTITAKSSVLYDYIKQYTGNISGVSGLTTFKDSPWGLTVALVPQPYFTNQDENTTVICCYGINTSAEGKYIDKEMRLCSGAELLFELIKYLGLDDRWNELTEDIINVIPCYMPYASASSLPYSEGDKPIIVNNSNYAFIGQFAKLGGGISYSSEYAVRTAREAVYRLTGTRKSSLAPPRATMASSIKMFRAFKK